MIDIPYYETSGFVFSNFSAHKVEYEGVTYATVEHAFHTQKFDDEVIRNEIRNCRSPLAAWELARNYKPQRRADWDAVKVAVLTDIIRAKVAQNEDVKAALLATNDEDIIEVNPHDDFWGNGPDGNGLNQTGKIYTIIRDELKTR